MDKPVTTLCYLEKDDSYLMLHRVKKKKDVNRDKWIGVGGKFEENESPDECLIREVREETALGAYLVEEMSFLYQRTEDHCTLTWNIAYREGAADPDSLMTLSDAQSLVDLLRLAVREGHEKLTARFSYEIPRQEAIDAVEQLWRELCAVQAAPEEPAPGGEASGEPSGDQAPPEETEAPSDAGEETQSGGTPQEEGSAEEVPAAETEPEYPPCPWEIRFYPDRDTAEIVEILLAELPPVQAEAPTAEIR